ncbi:transcriptional regulator, XRE family [Denitrovibrio acetiphilus DSM 12809]|uniref:Transcriptional regulator, XRE family n=1 Tax=Denitrovibrio acetiphilus (strain DSM 12809 / NBRC 114555 / N2460) TaxID=522772 RepID=D4H5C6_DENA2|nr:helix-turn-helix transcriptional regulator [Denitrovibrio acetiphilus]ADD67546.1 transcriptional regulator, XRE family [Denitrovibrio acetiphilus DSM 12809]
MDNINLKFGKKLRQLRTERNMTQEELAEKSGIDYKYLQKLEGQSPSSPTLSTLEKLAVGLDITIIQLLSDIQ